MIKYKTRSPRSTMYPKYQIPTTARNIVIRLLKTSDKNKFLKGASRKKAQFVQKNKHTDDDRFPIGKSQREKIVEQCL